MKEIILKDQQATFNALKEQSLAVANQVKKINITDASSLAIATSILSQANEKVKQIESVRVKEKQPFFDAGKEIDRMAKELSKPIEDAIADGKAKIVAYNKAEQEKANAELRRIQGIKDFITSYSQKCIATMDACKDIEALTATYNEFVKSFPPAEKFGEFTKEANEMRENLRSYATSRKTAILAPQEADAEESQSIKEHIQESVSSVGIQETANVVINSHQKGMRGKFIYEIVNESEVPREFMMVDDKKLKEWIKKHSDKLEDGKVSNGIKFIYEQSITIR